MTTLVSHRRRAFTVLDALVVVAVVLVLLVVLLPALAGYQRHNRHYNNCVSNLKQAGISFRIWQGDNNDKYPMNVPVALGGAQEMMATGNVELCFQLMSNELATPKILACSEDRHHPYATNFGDCLTPANLSYFVALDVLETNSQIILCGDDNLIQNRRPVSPGILKLSSARPPGPVTATIARATSSSWMAPSKPSPKSVSRPGPEPGSPPTALQCRDSPVPFFPDFWSLKFGVSGGWKLGF